MNQVIQKREEVRIRFKGILTYYDFIVAKKHLKRMSIVIKKALDDCNGFNQLHSPCFIDKKGKSIMFLDKKSKKKCERCVIGNMGKCVVCNKK